MLSAAVRRLPLPAAVPLPDRWHRTVTPVTGGIALFGAFAAVLIPSFASGAVSERYLPLVLGAGAAFALGLWDDASSIGRANEVRRRSLRSRSSPPPPVSTRIGFRPGRASLSRA